MAPQFQVTFDSAGPDKLADFWAAALSYIKQPPPEGYADWPTFLKAQGIEVDVDAASAIVDPSGVGPRVYFQKVPEPKTAKNRMHLDLNMSDTRRVGQEEGRRRVDTETQRLVGLGATQIRVADERGEYWVVMADPEGNEFCIQ